MPRFFRTSAAAALVLLGATATDAQHQHGATAGGAYQCGPPPRVVADVVPLWQGVAGTVHVPITTHGAHRDSVQAYFDQGVAWMYGYNFGEAVLSFRKAARFDPACTLCWWGVASALGPNINEPIIAQRWKMASAYVDTARMLGRDAQEWERDYLGAARARFQPLPANVDHMDPGEFAWIRQNMDRAYYNALQDIWQTSLRARAPDLTAATMYAEAALNLHPWDWWNNDGTARWPETDTAVAVSALVLRVDPRHVGAAHIAIHAREASQSPDSALRAAGILTSLMPGSAHLNHMPGHIYHRTGQYALSVSHNQAAVVLDSIYEKIRGAEWRYPMYYAHDNEFLWVSGSFVGKAADAETAASRLRGIVDTALVRCYSNAQHFLAAPGLVGMRFGKWTSVLDVPSPWPTFSQPYPRGMYHYTRGYAYLRTGQTAKASAQLDSLRAIAESIPANAMVSNNSARTLLRISAQILSGEMLAARGDFDAALPQLREAVALQDALDYDEPPPYFYPARHSLGAVLLQRGRPRDLAEADSVYRTDLGLMDGRNVYVINRNPKNGWALRGMVNTARALGRDTTQWSTQFRQAWDPKTPVPPGSRY